MPSPNRDQAVPGGDAADTGSHGLARRTLLRSAFAASAVAALSAPVGRARGQASPVTAAAPAQAAAPTSSPAGTPAPPRPNPAPVKAGAAPGGAASSGQPPLARRLGRLVVIGGNEDRLQDRVILRRFVAMCGGPDARIALITAASEDPQGAWRGYAPVFEAIGARAVSLLPMFDRATADDPAVVSRILACDGLFISGGDQNRLMEILWESAAARAIHIAFHLNGCCIGGTSAGAAVMSRHMLAQGQAVSLPQKDVVSTDIGLGLLSKAIIDQHFSERRRLGRLLSAMAQRPDLIGVGIDEDTALVIERGQAVEVLGQGTVTIVDGRRMQSNLEDIESDAHLELIGVQLHLLPAGHRYAVGPALRGVRRLPAALAEAVGMLVEPGPLRG